MPRPRLLPRYSLGLLLALVVVVGLLLGLRQAVYVPVAERAALRLQLEEAGLKVTTEAPGPSWRDYVFRRDDLLEVVAVEAVRGDLPPGVLPGLYRFPRLRSVKLRGCDVSDADTTHLAKAEGLTTLDVANTRVGDAGLARLAGLPLEDLDLMGTRITGEGLATVAGMTGLRRLILPARIETASLAGLAPLTGLTVLARETHPLERDGLGVVTLPEELTALALGWVGTVDNAWVPGKPESRPAPQDTVPAALLVRPAGGPSSLRLWANLEGDVPESVWARIGRSEEPWSLSWRRRDGSGLPPSALERIAALPSIGELGLDLATIDAAGLRGLLGRPGLHLLHLDVERLDMTPEAFVAAITATYPRGGSSLLFHLDGPWDFSRLPGLTSLVLRSPSTQGVLRGGGGVVMIRPEGEEDGPWSSGQPESRRATFRPQDPPPPDWLVAAMAAHGDWATWEEHFASEGVKDPAAVTARRLGWLTCPRTSAVAIRSKVPLDDPVWRALREEAHLVAVDVVAPLTDGQVLELLARPTLRRLRVVSPHLSRDLPARVGEFPHVEAVDLTSPSFDEGLVARHPERPGPPARLSDVEPGLPRRGEQSLALRTVGWPRLDREPGRADGPPEERTRVFRHDELAFDPAVGVELARRHPDQACLLLDLTPGDSPGPLLASFPRARHLAVVMREGEPARLSDWAARLPRPDRWETLAVEWQPADGTPEDLAGLDGLTGLRTLVLAREPVSDAGLARLATLPDLERLGLDRIDGGDAATPHDTRFLRNGRAWRALVAPDLRITGDDLDVLAASDSVERVVVDGLLIDGRAVPALERLLARGAWVRLTRPDLAVATVDRLRALAAAHGGSFDVTLGPFEAEVGFGTPWFRLPPTP